LLLVLLHCTLWLVLHAAGAHESKQLGQLLLLLLR
jgi:hypothetical protein